MHHGQNSNNVGRSSHISRCCSYKGSQSTKGKTSSDGIYMPIQPSGSESSSFEGTLSNLRYFQRQRRRRLFEDSLWWEFWKARQPNLDGEILASWDVEVYPGPWLLYEPEGLSCDIQFKWKSINLMGTSQTNQKNQWEENCLEIVQEMCLAKVSLW